MSDSESETQRQLAVQIAKSANSEEKKALRVWIEELLAIEKSDLSLSEKAQKAIDITSKCDVILPMLNIIWRECKRLGWDDRGFASKLALVGASIGIILGGGQGAGIAALGTAIGVPLWVVFGAGAAFLGVLYEEIVDTDDGPKTTYSVIDAERDEDDQR